MGVMSVRLSDNLSAQLEALAKATGRTKSFLAGQAIEDYIAREAWQVAEIEQALHEADAGDFVPAEEMDNLFQRLGVKRHGN
ncbi:TPA: CopG family ribbon-helix-helix protein [Salmonella enterica subsp. salamae serovar 35:g,m,s,t:-]|nr:ribbon-helix-helix protein, CopG family [Salmonella enterica]HAB4988708.1 ribbon-helix-helix protein, CopG family [Salmonella enterica subsp. salamae]HCA3406620.1 CopG family ribbon-helix-helix protein [Salmonella enterica subsp. salamae serovar 35:g,m,s,t:-]HCD5410160.1 CopG family ribbon-helix-helix protein [Klebsiella oxytoca]HCM1989766.1 CopG family ribbon-helix-helix protein [Salmonella enterica subsp. salamae serovar 30:m,t:-]